MSSILKSGHSKRTYVDSYIEYGVTSILKDGFEWPQCVVCYKVLSNDSMKPYQLKKHLKQHPGVADKDKNYLKLKETNLKRARIDTSGATPQLKQQTKHFSS